MLREDCVAFETLAGVDLGGERVEPGEFGAEVLQSYESPKDEAGGGDAIQVDGTGEWWCRGKKKCERHAG